VSEKTWDDDGCPVCQLAPFYNECLQCGHQREPEVSTEERRGARFREEVITVKTAWNFTSQIEQLVMSPTGVMQKRVLDTMEKQARDALIALGWTPPKT
jgi:hypothetical protein